MPSPSFDPVKTPHSDAVTVNKVFDHEALEILLTPLTKEKADAARGLIRYSKKILKIITAL